MGTHRMLINPDAIVNITRSGTTFTMTKADGSTATFDQQDNNSDTKVTQTVRTTNGNFPILVRGTSAGTSTTTTTASFAASTTINPSTGLITEAGVQMQRKYGTLIPFGTAIPANANLNTVDYLKVGNYYCSRNVDAATHTNSPTESAFMMQVYSPLSTTIDNEATGTWVYRFRVLQVYTGLRFTQYVYSGATAGTFTYGPWYLTVEAEADGAVGSGTQPVYLTGGKLNAANSFAGGTKVILNGTDTGASTATFYAPTGAGSSGQFLKSSGSGAPSWSALPAASGTAAGITIVYPAASCTTFSSDSGTCTPLAVQKAFTLFIADGTTNGTIRVSNGSNGWKNIAVAGLGTAAYTNSSAYAPASHGTHVSYGTSTANLGTASAGTASTVSRSDHVHKMPTYSDVGAAAASHGTHVTTATVKSALGTGSGTTKFLREDGNWATPAYYTLTKAKVEAVLTGAISTHTHSYLPLAGGTLTGGLTLVGSKYNYHSDTTNYGLNCNNSDIVGLNSIYTADSAGGMSEGIHFYVDGSKWDTMTASNGTFYFSAKTAVTDSSLVNDATIKAGAVYGAVWNDYAEYRETKEEIEAGRVVIENGDDTLSLATDRLMPGANIVSDTFGFAIGETENSKTPLAVSGRALAYPYEDRNSYKPGDPVCSGPNGTVSKMTREEVMMYPDRILGTVSAIPDYKVWGSGDVAVNGRIWIKVK